jgi:NAD(P)-dependent dehydrogenase (short-subunit alcohol dehydrogenase family)
VVAAARERFGRLDVLVNNAGVTSRDRGLDLLEAHEENFEWLMRVNLQGPFFLTQLAARWMVEQAERNPDFAGCVVFISSVSAEMVSDTRADYCLSKAALSLATKVWATRLAAHRIGVFEIRPGLVKTDLNASAWEKYDRFIAEGNLPDARWGTPDDIGRAVAMLARGDLSYATGQTLTLDGGLSLPRL